MNTSAVIFKDEEKGITIENEGHKERLEKWRESAFQKSTEDISVRAYYHVPITANGTMTSSHDH